MNNTDTLIAPHHVRILGRKNSANVQKVLWACEELGIDFEREDYGGQFNNTQSEFYLKLNPNGVVPTIVEDEFVLWESNAIVRYLAYREGDTALCPSVAQRRAWVEQWMDWQQSTILPVMTPIFWELIRTAPEHQDRDRINAARQTLDQRFAILNKQLENSTYVADDHFTAADIPIGVMAYRWYNLDIERSDYPDLARWYELIGHRSGFKQHVAIGLT